MASLQQQSALDSLMLYALALPFVFDAVYGLWVVKQVFSKTEEMIGDDLLTEKQEETKKYNDRLPQILKQTTLSKKVFTKGWKFDLFNEQFKVAKQISAISVIFAMIYFSLVGVINQSEHHHLSIMVLTYSLICLFSFFNLTYVRDFDAIQINFTPMALSVFCIISLMKQFDIAAFGMTLALVSDSYFAIRFKDREDKIRYTPIEMFALESWTQEAFSQNRNVTLQVFAASFIFVQIYLNMVNSIEGAGLSALILSFHVLRLIQFLNSGILGVQMLQSNMVCVALATISLSTLPSQSAMCILSTMVLSADALLGTAIFVARNEKEIK